MSSYEDAKAFAELVDASLAPVEAIRQLSRHHRVSPSHVRNLVRFYRVLPPDAHEAWRAGALNWRTLSRLASQVAQEMDIRGELAEVLRGDLRVSRGSTAMAPAWAVLSDRLRSAGPRLDTDDRAVLVLAVLDAAAGRAPMTRVEGVVDELLRDLGVGG